MVAPNPSRLKALIDHLYQKTQSAAGEPLEMTSWGMLAKKTWATSNLGLFHRLESAGVLEKAALVVQEQAVDLYASLLKSGMNPSEAQEQAEQQVILGFDPEALEPTAKNRPTSETSQ
jgi:hypothetical protein